VTAEEILNALLDTLNDVKVPYMVVGSFSSNFYGIPRSTKDADIVVSLPPGVSMGTIAHRLGPAFRLNPQAAFETITSTTKYVIETVDDPFTIEVFLLSGDEHDQQRFQFRRQVQLLGRTASLPRPEDVIIMKLRWAASREGAKGKDWEDVRNVIAVSNDIIDWPYVHSWCERHGTRALLDSIRESIPPL
jgi:hypothetical protein